MAKKSMALKVAGGIRRRVYPEVDRLRAEVASLRSKAKAAEGTTKKKRSAAVEDVDQQTKDILALSRPYTMTGMDKGIALVIATRHVVRTDLPGCFVECGVWRGGSVHTVAHVLTAEGVDDRDVFLFDTFEGMTEPTEKDVHVRHGRTASDLLAEAAKTKQIWAIASLDDVQEGLRTLNYPFERFHFVQGPVEETIPEHAPEQIALLRLDTDWYESTRHELEHLYDRLVPGGVLIIDDYGSWQGSKEATDEFLAKLDMPPMMLRAGRSRIGVKP